MKMIEPLASRMPWMIGYGNHELLPHDSGNETGVATTARFATPSDSGSDYWYSWSYRTARFIMVSTDSDYTPGSAQHRWLQVSPVQSSSAHPVPCPTMHCWLHNWMHK